MTDFSTFLTNSTSSIDPVVVSLLVTSVLTLLWVPLGAFTALRNSTSRYGGLHHELGGSFILWTMWLVETAVATNKWPTRAIARAFAFATEVSGAKKQGDVLITIVAFGWLAFSFLSIIKLFLAMHYAHTAAGAPASNVAPSTKNEKPPVTV